MEKKTLGTFLAALRKSSGMTQRQLADKLNVSDKAVSRWERDESAPDLTLIPVIAEIFGITSDELLRGQRNSPDSGPTPAHGEKSEKQLKRILKDTETRLRVRSSISLGLTALGLIAAMICNFAFLRARLGFLVGCVLYVAAAVCQVIFLIQCFAAIDDDSFDPGELNASRLAFFRIAAPVFSAQLVILMASVPLLFVKDAYMGITFGSWMLYAAIFAALGAILAFVICNLLLLSMVKKRKLHVEEKVLGRTRLKLRLFRSFLLVIAALFLIQLILNEITLVPGTSFDNWEDYKAFMETPMTANSYGTMNAEPMAPAPDGEITYYDEFGNEITEEEANTEQVIGPDGQVLCTYIWRNRAVYRITYPGTENMLPVTVYTADRLARENQLKQLLNVSYLALYIIAAA